MNNMQIDAILPFITRFEADGFTGGKWNGPPGQMPWFSYDESVTEFQSALQSAGWFDSSFDWPDWQETAQEYVSFQGRIDAADATTIQKLFTTHFRKDRFCEGHLASMFENGHIVALLRRLRVIRGSEKSP